MFEKISAIIKTIQVLSPQPQIWTPPDVAAYISEYMEQHPGKKLTKRLAYKLQREFYRSTRSSKK